ncbi:Thiamine-phosphate synthase [uncultured archaeon]|nr:Thiamine-phosphate synthase [uncultured archaeon]
MIKIAASILSADFTNMGDAVKQAQKGGANLIHFDVMDGHFVPNITFGNAMIAALKPQLTKPADVHLMITNPEEQAQKYIDSGANYLTFHIEATKKPEKLIQKIKKQGVKTGISIKPKTPLKTITPLLPNLDLVLIMSVEPGFGGQKFIPTSLEKIKTLRKTIDTKGYKTLISVDGGINAQTIHSVNQAGADIAVAGSAIFQTKNIPQAIKKLKEAAR